MQAAKYEPFEKYFRTNATLLSGMFPLWQYFFYNLISKKYDVMIEKYVGDVSFNEKRYKLAIKKYEAALKHTIDEADYIQYRVTLHNNQG
jgi:hypothetical protein